MLQRFAIPSSLTASDAAARPRHCRAVPAACILTGAGSRPVYLRATSALQQRGGGIHPVPYLAHVVAFIKSVTFDCRDPLIVARFWASVLGSTVDEESTPERAWVEAAGWDGPSLWFVRVPESKSAKNRQHFDLRPVLAAKGEVQRLVALGASVLGRSGHLVVMADPEGNEFCVE